MWRTFTYSILDVFAERPLEGNPLAVFHDAHALSGTEMQALARETNLAETAFILPCDPETEQRDGSTSTIRHCAARRQSRCS
jgi:trans-2,3-dihydro-3-hydroxyanthranilate isomerase